MNLINLVKMNAVGKLRSYIPKGGMNSVSASPFGGGAVDIVVVEQPDGSFRSSPWIVKFGKFHGILWFQDKIVKISVNEIEAGFHMYLSSAGKAYFQSEVDDDDDEGGGGGMEKSGNSGIERGNSSDAAEIAAQLLELQWWTNLTTKHRHKDAADDHEPEEIQCLSASERENCVDENLYKEEEEFFSSDLDDESKNSETSLSTSSSSSSCVVEEDSSDNDQPIDKHELADCNGFSRKLVKVLTPTSEEIASLNLKEGGNAITFTFCSSLGNRQIDARIYLWKYNSRIVISDVDGTITRSDVLGLCMPLVGVDWSQAGVARLYSAIEKNGYQLLFLSARSISQARITRKFLLNLKQDGLALPDGPVVISPDGIFPSLYREVIKRVPHEFKIACLEDIKALFPPDCNPFCAGFGNRDTDKISYLKVGVPKGKVFIINPKGEIIVDRQVQTESYTSMHTLVNSMFPPVT